MSMSLTGPDFRLDGRLALVTGSGRGIGLAIARALAAQGAGVAIQDIDQGVAEQEAARICAAGGTAVAFGGDVTDLTLPGRLVPQVVSALGGLHILVNNAAIQVDSDWKQVPAEQFELQLRANVTVPMLFCQQAVPIFVAQGFGRIINLGSIQQLAGNPRMLSYSIGKAALATMTKALAREMAEHQVTVNLIAPGYVAGTLRNQWALQTPQDKQERGRHLPMRRMAEPEDHAGMAVLLCSAAGSYITGQSIFVDGGLSTRS